MIDVLFSGLKPNGISRQDVRRAILCTFRGARRKPIGSVSIVFVSRAKIRALNRRWRKIDRATDVLSFPPAMRMQHAARVEWNWGDMFLAPAYIRFEAAREQSDFRTELLRVTIHGTLHLLGYDHATRSQERRMFKLQDRILSRV